MESEQNSRFDRNGNGGGICHILGKIYIRAFPNEFRGFFLGNKFM